MVAAGWHPGRVKEFLAALVGSVVGGLFALVGSYLGSRWQAKHQRSNLLHEAQIALYADIAIDCHKQLDELNLMCDFYEMWQEDQDGEKESGRYSSIEARIQLLASPRMWDAWEALLTAQVKLYEAMQRDSWAADQGFSPADTEEVRSVRRRLLEVIETARKDLGSAK
jgi:hypothetical protein